jgi:hypothetical protein
MQIFAPTAPAAEVENRSTPTPVPAPAPSQANTAAWRSMPSVWWPWMCQLLAVETTATSVDLELVALRRARVGGGAVEAGTPFTIRVPRSAVDVDSISDWADRATVVMVLAGRHGRSSWACLGVSEQRILMEGVSTTLGTGSSAA